MRKEVVTSSPRCTHGGTRLQTGQRVLRWHGLARVGMGAAAILATGCLGTIDEPSLGDAVVGPDGTPAGPSEPGAAPGSPGFPAAACGETEPPTDQPRRLNVTELNTIVEDVLGVQGQPFSAIGNDYGQKVGAFLGTSESFLTNYFDTVHDVSVQFVADRALGSSCTNANSECAREALAPVVEALIRRPVSDAYLDRLAALTTTAMEADLTFADGLTAAVEAVLMSPEFFVVGAEVESSPGVYPLDGYGVAERLSLTLWNSVPDDVLREAAERGDLNTDAGIAEQVERMLADEDRGRRFFDSFIAKAFQLPSAQSVPLGLEDNANPEALAQDLRQEAELALWDTFDRDRGLERLISSETTFVNQRLAEYYGLPAVSGDEFVEVSTAGTSRTSGLLTMGATLAQEGDLIHRGVNVLQTYMCQVLIPPDPEVIEAGLAEIPSDATVREEVEYRLSSPACQSCHALIDPMGAAFEVFDQGGLDRPTYENGDSASYRHRFLGRSIEGAGDVVSELREGDFSACLSLQILETVSSRRLSFGSSDTRCILHDMLSDLGPNPGLRSVVTRSFLTETFRSRVVGAP